MSERITPPSPPTLGLRSRQSQGGPAGRVEKEEGEEEEGEVKRKEKGEKEENEEGREEEGEGRVAKDGMVIVEGRGVRKEACRE
ncbi:hypothetical protein Pcinc_039652 [Petrolisthes cinctipes]|uniref:Uncharacterized protein n=1 Tax=Petrolisthes cinctipes TaxID=88211 RepID=A0AAE1BPC8_PETCI|nr:hypothetical protein Pcinc_039652 [Petrolisthes cinctipes]